MLKFEDKLNSALMEAGVTGRGPNFRTAYADAILAMAEVEGLDPSGQYSDELAGKWLDAQEQSGQYTAAGVRQQLRKAIAMHTGPITAVYGSEHVGTVKGANGNQRWFVTLNGQVLFATQFASSGKAIQKAQELGFGLK